MHIQAATTQDAAIEVTVEEPWEANGHVYGPDISVRPFGTGMAGHYWSMSLDEARDLVAKLNAGIADAEALFPSR